jgi:hypothetical protein
MYSALRYGLSLGWSYDTPHTDDDKIMVEWRCRPTCSQPRLASGPNRCNPGTPCVKGCEKREISGLYPESIHDSSDVHPVACHYIELNRSLLHAKDRDIHHNWEESWISIGFELGTSCSEYHIDQEHLSYKYRTFWSGQIWCLMRGLKLPPPVNRYSNSSEQNTRVLPPTYPNIPISFAQPFHLRLEWPVSDLYTELSAHSRNRSGSHCWTLPHLVTLERLYCRLYKVRLISRVLSVCLTEWQNMLISWTGMANVKMSLCCTWRRKQECRNSCTHS